MILRCFSDNIPIILLYHSDTTPILLWYYSATTPKLLRYYFDTIVTIVQYFFDPTSILLRWTSDTTLSTSDTTPILYQSGTKVLSQGRIQGRFVGFGRTPLGRTPNQEKQYIKSLQINAWRSLKSVLASTE